MTRLPNFKLCADIFTGHQTAIIDLEERHLQEKFQMAEQLLKESFILKRQLLMTRNAKVCITLFM
jgi:hypothetical protein